MITHPAAFCILVEITQLASPDSPESFTPLPFKSLNFWPQIAPSLHLPAASALNNAVISESCNALLKISTSSIFVTIGVEFVVAISSPKVNARVLLMEFGTRVGSKLRTIFPSINILPPEAFIRSTVTAAKCHLPSAILFKVTRLSIEMAPWPI